MSMIPVANNQPDDIKIRKYRDTLVSGGSAIILFGVWTVLKGIVEASKLIQPYLENMTFEDLSKTDMKQIQAMIEDHSMFYVVMAIVVAVLVVNLIIRAYVGFSARAVGLQKKTRSGKERSGIIWLIFGIILVVLDGYFLVNTLMSTGEILQSHTIINYIISLFVDVTPLYVTAEVVFTGFKLRKLSSRQEGTEEVQHAA